MRDFNMYLLETEVYFPKNNNLYKDTVKLREFNKSFMENKLSKILPSFVLSGGYVCSCCGIYLWTSPKFLCSLCLEEYNKQKQYSQDNLKRYYMFSLYQEIHKI